MKDSAYDNDRPLRLALCGMGSAGWARRRAIEGVPMARLVATVSRRAGVGDRRFEDILQDPCVEAVAVSTENADHEARVRHCLEADKHVLCDYPLAFCVRSLQSLFALASKKSLVLHVEHIALLSDEHLEWKRRLQKAGTLRQGRYLFQGGWSERWTDRHSAGPPAFIAVSRLLQLSDLFGPFKIEQAWIDARPDGMRLRLALEFLRGGGLDFTEERRVGLARRRSLEVETAQTSLAFSSATLGGGLFAKDLAWFCHRVRHQTQCYYDESMLFQVTAALETLS